MRAIPKPQPGEYPPYADMYIRLLPNDGLILGHLAAQVARTKDFISSIPPARLLHRYAPGKWSIKDVLVHIIDDERIFSYRALRFARNERQNLIGFDQDDYARYAQADARPLEAILEEYQAVRHGTIALFEHLPEDSLGRLGHGTGTANDATVRALVYHIAGHELHHLNIIRERYLS
jgi:uncharacterized damage-inducible protein DinB